MSNTATRPSTAADNTPIETDHLRPGRVPYIPEPDSTYETALADHVSGYFDADQTAAIVYEARKLHEAKPDRAVSCLT